MNDRRIYRIRPGAVQLSRTRWIVIGIAALGALVGIVLAIVVSFEAAGIVWSFAGLTIGGTIATADGYYRRD